MADILRPSVEQERNLHQRLLERTDPRAPGEVCRDFFPSLRAALERYSPRSDPDMRDSAITNALLEYCEHPEKFDPSRSLFAYLCMAARCDLLNLQRSENRHRERTISLDAVENDAVAGNIPGREKSPDEALLEAERKAVFDELVAELNEVDRQIVALMFAGERSILVYVPLLGLEGQPFPEQQRTVNKNKDRLKKWLERQGGRLW